MKQENTIYFEAKGKKITKIRSLGEIEQRAQQELFEICQKYNAQIKTKKDLDDFLKRVVCCDICKKAFYDKPCPKCRRKEIEVFEKEAQQNIMRRTGWTNEQIKKFTKEADKIVDEQRKEKKKFKLK